VRIAIVNDIAIIVEVLRRIVVSVPGYEVAWVARDGAEAVACCAADVPDVILMDLVMPVMDGVEATRRIMEATPCAILVVTASVSANASRVFDAMGYGALDAVNTPEMHSRGVIDGADALLRKIAIIGTLIGSEGVGSKGPQESVVAPAHSLPPLLLLGASTGGPRALVTVLESLPKDFPGAIVIVQHVDVQFAQGLAEWLARRSGRAVGVATAGSHVAKGMTLIAGSDGHLVMTGHRILTYSPDPVDIAYRPSVDVFFNSVAKVWPDDQSSRCAAAILTGMGADGAAGLRTLHDKGWYTVAQDSASSIVYGMPKAAVAAGAVDAVFPIALMGEKLVAYFRNVRK